MAFDHYVPAGVALGQLSFKDALKHKASVVEVASLAAREGDPAAVCVLYDNLVRLPLRTRVALLCARVLRRRVVSRHSLPSAGSIGKICLPKIRTSGLKMFPVF